MGAVWLLAGSEMRRRWRSLVALTLLVGIIGAIVLATVAGARRSSTALARFNADSRSADVELFIAPPRAADLERFRRTPQIASMALLQAYQIDPGATGFVATAAAVDRAMGSVIDRPRVIAGRLADPTVANEINIGENLAARLHLWVDGILRAPSYSPAQVAQMFSGRNPGRPTGPSLRLKVAGIVRRPLDLGDRSASGGILVLTPAFDREYAPRIGVAGDVLRVRARNGAADLPQVSAAARRIFGSRQPFQLQSLAIETQGAGDAIRVLTLALWVFAGVAALAGVVTIGIVLTREISRANSEQETLLGLGLTRRRRIAVSGPAAAVVALGGALAAVLGAVAVSPLFPLGVAGKAEPDPGLHFDARVLGLGFIAVVAVVALIALRASIRSTRRTSPAPRPSSRRSVAEVAAGVGLSATATTGLGMALRSGRGDTSVPVRSAFLGAVFGVLGVIAVLVFSASVQELTTTPRLYGWTWDFTAVDQNVKAACSGDDAGLRTVPGVAAVAEVCNDSFDIDGRPTVGWSISPLRGTIEPAIVTGRGPRTSHEVALGAVTLRALHKHLGDRVRAGSATAQRDYRVVGTAVFPTLTNDQPLADGAMFTRRGAAPLLDPHNDSSTLAARFTPGTDSARVIRGVLALHRFTAAKYTPFGDGTVLLRPSTPVEIKRLRQIDWYPIALAGLLGSLALVAVGHTLITSVRRRRHALAVLKTIGFDRRQVRATIAWHATTVAAVGLALGIPAGLFVGADAWRLVADGLGVSTTPSVPLLAVLFTIPAVVVLFNLIAFVPARAAARTRPAVELRSQ
jgi:hypothetical protein